MHTELHAIFQTVSEESHAGLKFQTLSGKEISAVGVSLSKINHFILLTLIDQKYIYNL